MSEIELAKKRVLWCQIAAPDPAGAMGSRESKAAALPGSGLVADVDKAQLEVHEMVYQKGVIDGSAEVLKQYESQRREWSAEKQKIMRAKVSEMLALEDKHTDAVSTKVAELQEAQRSKAPAMKPMCVAEEAACLKCYQDEFAKNEAGDVLKCAALVDAYRLCARAAAQDLLERK